MKRVKEKLYEKFEQSSDPIEDLNIGIPELRELRKSYKEYEKFLSFNGEDLDFTEVIDIINHLKNVIPYYVVFYFNQKYKLNIEIRGAAYSNFKYSQIYGGTTFAIGKIKGYTLQFDLSNSGLSININFVKNFSIIEKTPQCKSIHRLETAFLKICKKLGILF